MGKKFITQKECSYIENSPLAKYLWDQYGVIIEDETELDRIISIVQEEITLRIECIDAVIKILKTEKP